MRSIDKIMQIMSSKKMTGAELERRLGLSNSAFSQWKRGKNSISKENLIKISEILGVRYEDLLPDEEEVSAAFYGEELTKEEEDELWRKAKEFYDFLRQQKLKEKRRK